MRAPGKTSSAPSQEPFRLLRSSVVGLLTVVAFGCVESAAAFGFSPLHSPGLRTSLIQNRPAISPAVPGRIAIVKALGGRSRLALRENVRMVQQHPTIRGTGALTLAAVKNALETGAITSVESLDDMLQKTPIPRHPSILSGRLPNGLEYSILPNQNPPGRFECHLEVFAGSADELESQRGMAHMCEHVSYMGSRKRERLFGSSSQTNAQVNPSFRRSLLSRDPSLCLIIASR